MLERCFFLFKLAIIRCIQVRISQRHVHVSVLEQPKVLGEARVSPLQLDVRTKTKTFPSCSPCLALCWVQCSAYSLPLKQEPGSPSLYFLWYSNQCFSTVGKNIVKGREAKMAE